MLLIKRWGSTQSLKNNKIYHNLYYKFYITTDSYKKCLLIIAEFLYF